MAAFVPTPSVFASTPVTTILVSVLAVVFQRIIEYTP